MDALSFLPWHEFKTEADYLRARAVHNEHHRPSRDSRYCAECKRLYARETRRRYRDLSPEQKLKAKARSAAKMALRRGRLTRSSCSKCGATRAEMHHADYRRPLDVVWLCRSCHRREHEQ